MCAKATTGIVPVSISSMQWWSHRTAHDRWICNIVVCATRLQLPCRFCLSVVSCCTHSLFAASLKCLHSLKRITGASGCHSHCPYAPRLLTTVHWPLLMPKKSLGSFSSLLSAYEDAGLGAAGELLAEASPGRAEAVAQHRQPAPPKGKLKHSDTPTQAAITKKKNKKKNKTPSLAASADEAEDQAVQQPNAAVEIVPRSSTGDC